ncbi:hypothetical protein AQUCO_06700048v1 [Aquilegia coerulea]|uniref:Uncharacterized protein n=1 Tax=Aquilegia coerulea TaxID=218851 RepID=A0A2G5CBU3_AQUCA|nr:hypothetical protein AQUCO_06700048v1 [Aquilegia coerulea]
MNFSEEWKSLWTVSSVYDPPLLISSKLTSSSYLGPLVFNPCSKTPINLLLTSPFISSHFSIPRPPDDPHHEQNPSSKQIPSTPTNNILQKLRCSKNECLLLFPYGDHLNKVGFVKISLNGSKPEILSNNILETEEEFDSRVERIEVSSLVDFLAESADNSPVIVIGFLLACTLNKVHWYRVEIRNTVSDIGKPALVYLGTKTTKSSRNLVVHACWSPHLPEESLVLLKNGKLFLFDLEHRCKANKFPRKLKGTRVSFDIDNLCKGEVEKNRWLSCGFSWHPQIFIVAGTCGVFLVDSRFEKSDVSILAKIEMFHLNCTITNSQFIAFCMAGTDGFYFAVATEDNLFLIDIRKPMMSVLQWAHSLDNPHYINVFRLSELRSTMQEDRYKWASDSGLVILLGSFSHCKFNLFCYGPPLPVPDKSVAFNVSKFCNSFYAWELPSEISLLGRQCNCSDCLLGEDISNETLPEWKKEKILGFCVIGEDLSESRTEADDLSGFTLIRLVSFGKLESQKYIASCDFTSRKKEECGKKSSQVVDSFLDLFVEQKYKFPRRFRYINLKSLIGFMSGDLPKVLMSKLKSSSLVSSKTKPYTADHYERIRDIMKTAGVDSTGFYPTIENVLSSISWPMSINEITSSRMWGRLNMDLLQLAFIVGSELGDVLVEHRKISLEGLDIPTLPQLPPFFSKTPTRQSSTWSWKLQKASHEYREAEDLHKVKKDVLLGPVLPLPFLGALHKVKNDSNCWYLEEEENWELELTQECNEVMRVASEMALSGSHCEVNESPVVSLAKDREESLGGFQKQKSLFFFKPCASLEKNGSTLDSSQHGPIYEDNNFDTFVSRTHTSNPKDLVHVGLDFFDDLCPIELNFDFPDVKFGVKEFDGFKKLKQQFSNWQNDNTQYQDFCKSLKIQKKNSLSP